LSNLNVVSFKPVDNMDVKDVVKNIEELLEMAKKGEIEGLAVVALGSDDSVNTMYCGNTHTNVFTTIGALDVFKQRLIAEMDEPE